jgi:hypothetical protein
MSGRLEVRFPIAIDHLLNVRIGDEVARLSPRQGLTLAERLIRASTRRMIVEAAEEAEAAPRSNRERYR